MAKRYTKYSKKELLDFIGRIDTVEKLQTAQEFIAKLTLPEEWKDEIEAELLATGDIVIHDDFMERYFDEDRGSYSPSCPWNAPGMKVSDFITGVIYY